jgi:hypothetical protein
MHLKALVDVYSYKWVQVLSGQQINKSKSRARQNLCTYATLRLCSGRKALIFLYN